MSYLPNGYLSVAPGHIASVVTDLEMRVAAPCPPGALPAGVTLRRVNAHDLDAYRAVFRQVGADWLWFSRLYMDDGVLQALLSHPQVQSFYVCAGEQSVGLLELDFRQRGECELSFLGLTDAACGQGLGRALMREAIGMAWAQPIHRFWVHTCTCDHPAALAFYRRSGFVPCAIRVEVQPDPRLSGHLPRSAAPHMPLIAAVDPAQG